MTAILAACLGMAGYLPAALLRDWGGNPVHEHLQQDPRDIPVLLRPTSINPWRKTRCNIVLMFSKVLSRSLLHPVPVFPDLFAGLTSSVNMTLHRTRSYIEPI